MTGDAINPPHGIVRFKDERNFYLAQILEFRRTAEKLGLPIGVERYPEAEWQFADPSTVITIFIDPETIKQIFEYATALIGIYKSSDYIGTFFQSCVQKLGEMAGAKFGEVLSTFFRHLYTKMKEVIASGEHTRLYLSLETNVYGVTISADIDIYPSYLDTFSEQDLDQATNLLYFKVLPASKEFIKQSHAYGIELKDIRARLRYPDLEAASPQSWEWRVEVRPIGEFSLARDGTLRPVMLYISNDTKRKRMMRKRYSYNDIQSIVKEYKR